MSAEMCGLNTQVNQALTIIVSWCSSPAFSWAADWLSVGNCLQPKLFFLCITGKIKLFVLIKSPLTKHNLYPMHIVIRDLEFKLANV